MRKRRRHRATPPGTGADGRIPQYQFGAVVVNWNNPDDTVSALASLASANPGPAHVVLVDNGSTDGSLQRFREWQRSLRRTRPELSGWLTILSAGANIGFAKGNNLGIRYLERKTTVTHILLLNNDATVAPDFLARIADALREVPGTGLVTGTIYEDPARDRVWFAGGVEFPLRALYKHRHDVPSDATTRPTDFVTGCAMVLSRELLNAIGPLPECYFMYWEDGEYSYKARERGFPVLYAPRAVAYHKVGATAGPAAVSPFVTHCQARFRAFYVRRNYTGLRKVAAVAYLVLTKPGRATVEALKGRPRIGWAVFSGTFSGLFSQAARE